MPISFDEVPRCVLTHVVDVHCHPTDSEIPHEVIDTLPITICAMATRQSDQSLVGDLASRYPGKVIPCFGYHPWFTHWIKLPDQASLSKEDHYRRLLLEPHLNMDGDHSEMVAAFEKILPSLPDPILLDDILSDLRSNLSAHTHAMLGEVGLDRAAKVPYDHRAAQRKLSPFTVPLEHQVAIVTAQIDVAVELQRNISFHSVKSQKHTVDLLSSMKQRHGLGWNRVSIDMHSCGLSVETWGEIERLHANAFLSMSVCINSRSPAHKSLLAAASATRILVESDFHDIKDCSELTWEMINTVAEVRGWQIEKDWQDDVPKDQWGAIRRLEENWKSFLKGDHTSINLTTQNRKERRLTRNIPPEVLNSSDAE